MPKMDDNELGSVIRSEIQQAQNYFETEFADARMKAIDYYLGEPLGNERDGFSSVVSHDFADVVETLMPSLMRIFTSSDKYVRYAPRTAEDAQRAEQLTDYVNYIINQDNDGYRIIHTFIKDSLLFKLGVIKFGWDESYEVEEAEYNDITDEELVTLLQNPDIEVVSQKENTQTIIANDGEETEVTSSYNMKVKIRKKSGRVKLENVPPEEFIFNKNAKSLEDCYFICHRTQMTVSELVSMGYDQELVEQYAGDVYGGQEREEKQRRFEDIEGGTYRDPEDDSQKDVIVNQITMKVDYDGDGIAELRQILAIGDSGDVILENDVCDYIPFAVVSPILMPHRLVGRSIFDATEDLQTIKTTLMRQYLDSTYHSVLPRLIVQEGQTNLDDVLDGTAGGIIRVRNAGAVQPLQAQGVGREIQPLMQYLDEVKADRTGVSRQTQGLDPSVLQSTTASAVQATVKGSQQKVESYARTIAETGMKDLFRGILHIITNYQQQPRIVRLRNKFVPVDPQEGSSGFDIIVNVGLGTANDEQKVSILQGIASKQEVILQTLGVDNPICNLAQYANTLRQMVDVLGFKDADQFFKPPQVVQAEIAQRQQGQQPNPEIEKIQAEIEAEKIKLESKIELDRLKLQAEIELKKEEAMARLDIRRQEMALEAELRVAKAVTDSDISTNLPRN
jgi:hypothetical protein|tara:strand:+ start:9695 stop:11725 length:2031 start_codon:yes stop_codon:yes gene_type:complete